jgi:hypothetical protein
LLPTYLKYGFMRGMGGTPSAIKFNSDNLVSIAGLFKRSLSLAIFDLTSFIGGHTVDRIAFLRAESWLIPFVVFLFIVSILQAVALIVFWFRRDIEQPGWRPIKYLVVFNLCWVYLTFLLSMKPPQSNHLYITFPLLMIYSLYCWNRLLKKSNWQLFAKIFLASGIIFHIGLAVYRFPRISLYPVRPQVQSAIDKRDYHILGERRPNTLY